MTMEYQEVIISAGELDNGLCKSCRYWRSFDNTWGSCHRRAPRPFVGGSSGFIDVAWPQTKDIDFCGEWGPK